VTLPKGYGDRGKEPNEPRTNGKGKGKKIGFAIGVVVAVIVAAGVIGSTYQANNPVNPSPLLKWNPNDSIGGATLAANIAYAKDPITRGSTQTITISVNHGNFKASGALVDGTVTYASGSTIKAFSGTTDENGQFSYSWRIGGSSNPGIFTVNVDVSSNGESLAMPSSFSVIEAF
jgi:hypothetical protein